MKFTYKDSCLVPEKEIEKLAMKLVPYVSKLKSVAESQDYDQDECSICLPCDTKIKSGINDMVNRLKTEKLKYVVTIGIGGSYLGTRAVYDALFGSYEVLEPDHYPKMIFLDTNDPEYLDKYALFFNKKVNHPEEIILCAISKKGTTTETVVNSEIASSIFNAKFGNVADRLVIISDEDSKIRESAKNIGAHSITIPKKVGGRYSVLSAVGLFPLALVGVDIENLTKGACKMVKECISPRYQNNPAVLSAAINYWHYTQGKNINDTFVFDVEMESVGKWYRQLMGESLGKETNLDGKRVNAGITPTVSVGSNELHSVVQLNLAGPKDKTTNFVCSKSSVKLRIPEILTLGNLIPHIAGKSPAETMRAYYKGTKIAYRNYGLPFVENMLDGISEYTLGEWLQFKMVEMMYLAKLMNVNAFDQPNVEDYKIETKKILSQK